MGNMTPKHCIGASLSVDDSIQHVSYNASMFWMNVKPVIERTRIPTKYEYSKFGYQDFAFMRFPRSRDGITQTFNTSLCLG